MVGWLDGYDPKLWCVQKLLKYIHTGQDHLIENHILEYGVAIWDQIFEDECEGSIPIDTLNHMPYIVWASFVKLNSRKSLGNRIPLHMADSDTTRFFYEDYNDFQPFGKKFFFKFIPDSVPVEDRAQAAWELFCLLPKYEQDGFSSLNNELIMTGYFLSDQHDDTFKDVKNFAGILASSGSKEIAVLATLIKHGSTDCVHAILPIVLRLNRMLRTFFMEILHERAENDFIAPVEWLETLYVDPEEKDFYSGWVFGLSGEQVRERLLTVMTSFDTVKPVTVTQ